jgi:hypothetical protein
MSGMSGMSGGHASTAETGWGDPVPLLRAAGLAGPVLVVADAAAISRLAPAWAEAFAAAGWLHRVLDAGHPAAGAAAAIAAEAASLRAAVLVAAGDAAVVAVVEQAAAACRLPCVTLPCAVGHADRATL